MNKIITSLLTLIGLAACSQQAYDNADPNTFATRLTEPDVVLLDVRTANEYNEGHIANAINIDVKEGGFVEKAKSMLPAEKTVAVYCKSGVRSVIAAKMLAKEGFKVVNLQGGIKAWKEAGMLVETTEIRHYE